MQRFLKARDGLETIEAAITTPIAVLIMLATINLGMVIFGQQAVQAAARHGARMGSLRKLFSLLRHERRARSDFVSKAGAKPKCADPRPWWRGWLDPQGAGLRHNSQLPGWVYRLERTV